MCGHHCNVELAKTRFIYVSHVFIVCIKLNWRNFCATQRRRAVAKREKQFAITEKALLTTIRNYAIPHCIRYPSTKWTQWIERTHKIPTRLGHHHYYSYMEVTTIHSHTRQTSPQLTYFHTWQLFFVLSLSRSLSHPFSVKSLLACSLI